VISKHTYSKITKLNEQARAMELARMLGGGAAAEKHAAAMINDNS
jgi:DNA repair ATPase RecN